MNNFKERITTTETDNDEYNLKEKYLNLFDKYGTYTYIFLFIGIVLSFFISKTWFWLLVMPHIIFKTPWNFIYKNYILLTADVIWICWFIYDFIL